MIFLALVVAGSVLWTPGALLARAAGARRGWALVTAPAVTWGLVGLGAVAVPAVGLRWHPWTALGWCALAVVVTAVARRLLTRRRAAAHPPAPRPPRTPRRQVAAVGAAVAAATLFMVVLGWRSGAALDRPGQLWDAVWHANLTTWIATTGRSDPSDAATALVSAGWRTVPAYYPDALHALAALVVQLTGAPPVVGLTAVVVITLTAVVPLGVAALVWRLTGGSAVGASAAALVCVLPLAFPTDQWWRGTWSFGAGLAVVPLALAVVVTAAGTTAAWTRAHRTAPAPGARTVGAVPAVLALAGLAALQPAAAVVAGVVLVLWLLGRWAGRSWRLDLALLAAAVAGALAVARAVEALVPLSPTLSSLGRHDYARRSSLVGSTEQVLGLVTPVARVLDYPIPLQPPQVVLAVLLVVAAVVVALHRRTTWLALAWVLFVAAGVATVLRGDSWLDALTLFFYSSPFRLVAVVALLGSVVVGVAVAHLGERWPGGARRGSSRRRGTTAAVAGLAVLAVAGAGTLSRGEVRLRVGYGDRVVGPDQVAVMEALAAQPLPAGARVLNDSFDGSPWLYALTGRMPMFTHYNAGRVSDEVQALRDHLHDVDTDPAVRRLLRQERICLVYTNDTTVAGGRERSPGFTGLDGLSSLELVARQGGAAAYRVADSVGSCR